MAMNDQVTTTIYEIRVKGHLGNNAASWFPNLAIDRAANGETILRGPVVDQSALHGILMRIRDLGLILTLVWLLEDQ